MLLDWNLPRPSLQFNVPYVQEVLYIFIATLYIKKAQDFLNIQSMYCFTLFIVECWLFDNLFIIILSWLKTEGARLSELVDSELVDQYDGEYYNYDYEEGIVRIPYNFSGLQVPYANQNIGRHIQELLKNR